MTQVSWDVIYRPSSATPPVPGRDTSRRFAFLVSWEAWLTLGLIMLLQFPVVGSLESTRWVGEMPSLVLASFVGLTSGWLLASTRGHALWLHLIGIVVGLVVVLGEVLATMRLADPLVASGFGARRTELWLRMGDWVEAAVAGTTSSDPLPFVVMLVFLVWALAYVSAWAVVRWQNIWAAIVPGGFVLLTNISYLPGQPSFSFVVFLFAAVLVLARMQYLGVLRRWRRERVSLPDFMSIEVLFAGVWIALVLVVAAWLIPTANNWGPAADRWRAFTSPVTSRVDEFGRLFVGIGSKKPLAAHAFDGVFPLRGRLSLSDTVLMEISAPGPLNLRGAVYDEYTGSGWRVSSASSVPLLGTSVQAAEFGTPETRAQVRQAEAVEITVTAEVPDRRLLSAGEPLAASVEAEALAGASLNDLIALVPAERLRIGGTYSTVGTVSAAAEPTLLQSGRNYPPEIVARDTTLPRDLSPRIAVLAREIAGPDEPPYAVARAVEQYLRDNYTYTLDIADPPPLRDSLEYFLFDSHTGYFDYHASAMAVLLRSFGIPTRVVTGFVLDDADLSDATKTYAVTERRAWAWPEVYFAGLGWVEFNPTPNRPPASRPLDDSALIDPSGSTAGANLTDPFEQLLLEELLADNSQTIGRQSPADAASSGGVGDAIVLAVELAIALSALALVAVLAARFAWEWSFRGLAAPVKRWAKIQRLAGWADLQSHNTRTPLEATQDIASAVNEPAALERLARAFTASRYGAARGDESEEQARDRDADYGQVQRKLWSRAIGRRLRMRGRGRDARDSALRGAPTARR
ncbi:MAG: transglutaminase-like domain-containing protein [Chloroflexi bacterium]|nr:transglutaminase-like domain-containing protein [Chloroflexota bacterium]